MPLGDVLETFFGLLLRKSVQGELTLREESEWEEAKALLNTFKLEMDVTRAEMLTCLAFSEKDLARLERAQKERVQLGLEEAEELPW